LSGGLEVSSDSTIFSSAGTSPLTFTGAITGSSNLTIRGTGVIAVTAASTFSGQVNIYGVYGGGTVSLTGTHTIYSGGAITAYDYNAYAPSVYTVGALTINSGGILNIISNGSSSVGRIAVTGAFAINGAWTVNWTTATSAGTYTIVSTTGTLPTQLPTIGTNTSGRTIVFGWVSGVGLQATLS
jgi:hypothetical protein